MTRQRPPIGGPSGRPLLAVGLLACAACALAFSGGPAPAADTAPVSAAEARKTFWAFQPVRPVAPPPVKDAAWPAGEVDRFLLAAMESRGLRPNPPADKRTLIRRATFDLTGLPPSPEEVKAFLDDASPEAYAKVVERLLASPRYGERWGRHWLDVVRYADTAGDGADYPVREAYRYRNYVIDAFNADKPYDQFLREQVAGDVLAGALTGAAPPEKYAELVTATGYLAVTKRFGYNVAKDDFHHLDIADTIEVLGRSVLGLSVGCARCHDHKHDPVSAADYYALYGIFNSTIYTFPGGEETKHPVHLVSLLPPGQAQPLEAERRRQLAEIDAKRKAVAERVAAAAAELGGVGGQDLAFEAQAPGRAPAAPWFAAGPNTISADAQSPYANAYPAGTRGVRLGSGVPTDGVRQNVVPPRTPANTKVLHFNADFRTVDAPAGAGSYRFHLGQGAIVSTAVEFSVSADAFAVRNGDGFEVVRKLQPGVWYNVRLALDLQAKTFSGTVGTPEDAVTIEGKAFRPGWNGTIDAFFLDGFGHAPGAVPARDLDNVAWRDAPFDPPSLQAAPPPDAAAMREKQEKAKAALAALGEEEKKLQRERDELAARPAGEFAYGVSEGKPANARIQLRGEPLKLGDEVPRRFIEVLGGDPLPPGATGSGRLELAGWLTRPENPLTARVMVNRIWQYHFGRGIVATPSDFGTRGEAPTHPELLDWLAARFVASGWSVKAMHRTVMLSRAYQASGDESPEAMGADPESRLLWRFPGGRLDAESIRDAMLAVGGNLDLSRGGAHPFPPVETWQFTIHNPFYAVYETNRRSVYLMVQRQKRHPFLALFDGADPNLSTEGRQSTTTPTQALFLMNDPFVHAQSAGLAKRLLASPGDEAGRVRLAFGLCFAREPDGEDLAAAAAFLNGYRDRLAALGKPAEEQSAGAWAAYARVLLTSNEFLHVN